MTDLPAALKAAIAAELALSVLAAAFGTPPRRRHRRGWELLLLAGVLAVVGATVALHAAHELLAMKLALAAGVELLCGLTWLRRGVQPDDDDGDDGEPPAPPPGFDWDAFDLARSGWEPSGPRTGRSVRT
jgi:hypothetical protein